jgi:hypothetical protein
MTRKLPPWKIFNAALRLLGRKWVFVIKIGWPLILFSGLVGISIDSGFLPTPDLVRPEDGPLASGNITVGEGWESFVVSAGMIFLTSFAAIFWHRNILLDEHHVPALPFRLDGIFWRFMGYSLLLVFLLVAALVLLFALLFALPIFVTGLGKDVMENGWLAFVPLLLFILFVAARAGLAFPAAAVGNRGLGINASWQTTRRNSCRILLMQVLTIFLSAVIGFAWMIASDAIADVVGNLPYMASYVANGTYQLFFVLLGVGLLSLTYAWLVDQRI